MSMEQMPTADTPSRGTSRRPAPKAFIQCYLVCIRQTKKSSSNRLLPDGLYHDGFFASMFIKLQAVSEKLKASPFGAVGHAAFGKGIWDAFEEADDAFTSSNLMQI